MLPSTVPSAAPRMITVYNTSSTSVSVQWRPIPENFTNGVLLGYQVDCFLLGSPRAEQTLTTSNDSVEFQGLKKFTRYLVTVAGYTRKGLGVSDTVPCRTDEDGKRVAIYGVLHKRYCVNNHFYKMIRDETHTSQYNDSW